MAVSKQQSVNMETILQHELAAIPPALFPDNGNMRKCVKADLAIKLESTTEVVLDLPPLDGKSIYIYDGMALYIKQNSTPSETLLSSYYLKLLFLNGLWNIQSVVHVFDHYYIRQSVKQHVFWQPTLGNPETTVLLGTDSISLWLHN